MPIRVLAISMFLFLSLALVKRCAELEELAAEDKPPAPGRGYQPRDLVSLRAMGMASGFLAVMVLTLYIDSQGGRAHYRQPEWLWAAALIGLPMIKTCSMLRAAGVSLLTGARA